ncbi:MAG: Co2+/Mg2+ efflux protein ApaG [Crocinitomicaceae bacterium]|nr:Co2+/Mg2+ efflux protein ApaG [Crocinitomicaceae bacterium]
METTITKGIKISVVSSFKSEYSNLLQNAYYFEYRIQIENKSEHTVKLIRRDWFIYDSLDLPRYVSGEGVVGQQPILSPGEIYQYTSGSDLSSEIGYMTGHYTFIDMETALEFPVYIPRFDLIFPAKMN